MTWERAFLSTDRLAAKPANMITTFDSIERSLQEFLRDVHSEKLKLSEFQHGWE